MQSTNNHISLNAHLLSGQTGYRGAGINGYIAHLLHALPDADPLFHYTVMLGHQAMIDEHRRFTLRRTPFSTVHPLRRILWEQMIQPFSLWRARPDLLHALAFVSPVLSRVPSVVTVYDLSFIHYPQVLSSSRRLYLRLFTRRSCEQARRVIAISQSTARDLTDSFGIPPQKIDVAVPGVSERFCPLPPEDIARFRQENGLPDRFLFFVGTLEPRKNLSMLLRAYAQLPAGDRQAVHLVLAGGKGWMYDDIFRTMAELDLSDTVHLPGYLPADQLPLWYNAADAFVYPSIFEGFGLPVVEAMACGTPVLVSNVSSLPEAVGDAGRQLPPGDVSAWTEALAQVIHDAAWRDDFGERGRLWSRHFTWANTALQTVACYRKALQETRYD